MFKNNTYKTLLGLTAGLLIAGGAAQAKIETLPECYDAVIAYCNDKHGNDGHASGCASGGFDQCDDQFDASINDSRTLRLKAKSTEAKGTRSPGRTRIAPLKYLDKATP